MSSGAASPLPRATCRSFSSGSRSPSTGNLVIVRQLVNNAGPADIDTANCGGPRSQYTVTANANGSITVLDTAAVERTDTLWNIEQLHFADQLVSVGAATVPAVTTNPTAAAGVAFGSQTVTTTSAARTVTVSNTGNGPLAISSLTLAGANAATSRSRPPPASRLRSHRVARAP